MRYRVLEVSDKTADLLKAPVVSEKAKPEGLAWQTQSGGKGLRMELGHDLIPAAHALKELVSKDMQIETPVIVNDSSITLSAAVLKAAREATGIVAAEEEKKEKSTNGNYHKKKARHYHEDREDEEKSKVTGRF